jgi:hypothetical protein
MFKTRAAELRLRVINFTDVILPHSGHYKPRTLPRVSRAHLGGQKFEAETIRAIDTWRRRLAA